MSAYHEAFWVVIGTAAPVIALSYVVAISEIVKAYPLRIPKRYATRYIVQMALTMLGFTLTLITLTFTLASLDHGHNSMPTAVAGLLTLISLFGAMFTAGMYLWFPRKE